VFLIVDNNKEIERIRARKLAELMERAQRQAAAEPKLAIPTVLTDQNFSEVVAKSRLILVDFWAAWCQPCKVIAPFVEDIGRKYAGRLAIGKMDVDANQLIPGQFGIQSIPTLLLFKDGTLVDGIVGAVPKSQIEAMAAKWM